MVLTKQETERVRVAPQLMFSRRMVSLIAEETVGDVIKGSVVKTVTRKKLHEMITECKEKNEKLWISYSQCKKLGL